MNCAGSEPSSPSFVTPVESPAPFRDLQLQRAAPQCSMSLCRGFLGQTWPENPWDFTARMPDKVAGADRPQAQTCHCCCALEPFRCIPAGLDIERCSGDLSIVEHWVFWDFPVTVLDFSSDRYGTVTSSTFASVYLASMPSRIRCHVSKQKIRSCSAIVYSHPQKIESKSSLKQYRFTFLSFGGLLPLHMMIHIYIYVWWLYTNVES